MLTSHGYFLSGVEGEIRDGDGYGYELGYKKIGDYSMANITVS
jgi:hypothetical protein